MAEPKITSKNLAYASDLPPFLARLHGHQQQQRNSDSPDPILAARRRAARPRSKSEEAEDAPLVVDEEGNTVALPDTETDVPTTEAKESDDVQSSKIEEADEQKNKEKEKVAGIGAGKKRKVGRVVGGDEDEGNTLTTGPATAKGLSALKNAIESSSKDAKPSTKQGKKKAKKIKLSFGDDGD